MAIKNKIILTLILSFILIVLINVLIVFPLINKIKNNSQELINTKQKTATLITETTNLGKFNNLNQEVESFLKQIDDLLVNPDVLIEFINFLEETSESNNVEIESLNLFSRKEGEDYWPFIIFQISCQARFADFLVFLEKLENNLYLVETQSMAINRLAWESEKNSFKNIRASFSIKVLTRK